MYTHTHMHTHTHTHTPHTKGKVLLPLWCPTLCDPMDCSPPGSSVRDFPGKKTHGLPFPSAGNLPNSGMEPRSPVLQADSLLSRQGSPTCACMCMCVYVYVYVCACITESLPYTWLSHHTVNPLYFGLLKTISSKKKKVSSCLGFLLWHMCLWCSQTKSKPLPTPCTL